ncbi:HAMP domain-containing protein [Spirulina subsalsa FACHB-351]|uniref:histidine kinase n=2 Tax=Spirulina subsalsa TaxID=54311 RepID=A0ABT3L4S6_9CYAN|nr:HAMP domain-containing protein [Spirulina subsalsa FACHB-351]
MMQTSPFFLSLRRKIPLSWLLTVPLVVQVTLAVTLTGWLAIRNTQEAVRDLANQLGTERMARVEEYLINYLNTPHRVNQININAVRSGQLDIQDPSSRERQFYDLLTLFPEIGNVAFAGVDGSFTAVQYEDETRSERVLQMADLLTQSMITYGLDEMGRRTSLLSSRANFDVRTREWYQETLQQTTQEQPQAVWNPIFNLFGNPRILVLPVSELLYDNGEFIGMVSARLYLSDVDEFLAQLDLGQGGKVFIMERDGSLVASSVPDTVTVETSEGRQRVKAEDSDHELMQEVGLLMRDRLSLLDSRPSQSAPDLAINHEEQFIQILPFAEEPGLDWFIVVAVPKSEVFGQIQANSRNTILLCVAGLILAIGFGYYMARRIAQPILALSQTSLAIADDTQSLKNPDNQGLQPLPPSPIQELDRVAHSFNQMTTILQDAFQRLENTNSELEQRVGERTSELTQALANLKTAQMQLIQAEKMSSLEQLVGGIAHEINNPVNFIYGNIQHTEEYANSLLSIIQEYQRTYPKPPPELLEHLEDADLDFVQEDLPKLLYSMRVGSERIKTIVAALRIFARLDEAGFKDTPLQEGLDSTLAILTNQLKANEKRPEIQIIKDYQPIPLVECDPGQINQVFLQIITNAIEAFNELEVNEPTLWINTLATEQDVMIQIADNGGGIPEEIQGKIFDPFFTTKPVGHGTGLGLAISYQIVVEQHGGNLTVDSTSDQGTKFTITLPRKT